MFATPGRVLDLELVARYIGRIYDAWRPRVCGYDPAWAAYLTDELGAGASVVTQGGAKLNTPSVHFEGLVETGQVDGCGNPCTAWQVQHAAADEDRLGRIRVKKSRSGLRCDGVAAAVNALAMVLSSDWEFGATVVSVSGR